MIVTGSASILDVFRPQLPSLPLAFLWLGSLVSGLAQSPVLNHAIPSAVSPGRTTHLTLSGENFAGATELWTSFPAHVTLAPSAPATGASDSSSLGWALSVSSEVRPGIGAIRLATTNGLSNLLLLTIDDLSNATENTTNKALRSAQYLAIPGAIDGVCEELSFDYYQIEAQAGQQVNIDVVAHRLGSLLDPILRLLNSSGRELAYCDDALDAYADARLSYRFPAAGRFFIEVRDTRYQGGPKYRYRLRVSESPLDRLRLRPISEPEFVPCGASPWPERLEVEPNDSPSTALPIPIPLSIAGTFAKEKDRDFYEFDVEKGQRLVMAGLTRSLGFPCDLYLELRKSNDSLVAEANVTGIDEGTITNTFTEAGTYRLLVEELNQQGGPGFGYRLDVRPQPPGFALSVDSDKIEAAQGGSFDLKVTCLRREYAGPITLALAGGGSGNFILSDNVIPPKTNAAQVKVTVSADLPPGHMVHFTVQGRAQIEGATYEAQASTMPAIRKLFPQMLYPPPELDGLIALGVKAGRKSE
ncbi:MAG: PPC domain-containing protein [Verrucomicrobia bacterium]|nr:PPC domain-containing protein [Verrucomicrobiota bacterium]